MLLAVVGGLVIAFIVLRGRAGHGHVHGFGRLRATWILSGGHLIEQRADLLLGFSRLGPRIAAPDTPEGLARRLDLRGSPLLRIGTAQEIQPVDETAGREAPDPRLRVEVENLADGG